jgi:hypothetical protein
MLAGWRDDRDNRARANAGWPPDPLGCYFDLVRALGF